MPKVVDHDERRRELAAAVWRVVNRDGIAGATVRAVAAEAGISPGRLRHYFADQAGLILFAAEAMAERVVVRLDRAIAELDGLDRAQRLLEELVPMDADRAVEGAVWIECLIRARSDERLAPLTAASRRGTRRVCRLAWASAQSTPAPAHDDAPFSRAADERAAKRLHTFVDGITLQAVAFPAEHPPEYLRARITETLRPTNS